MAPPLDLVAPLFQLVAPPLSSLKSGGATSCKEEKLGAPPVKTGAPPHVTKEKRGATTWKVVAFRPKKRGGRRHISIPPPPWWLPGWEPTEEDGGGGGKGTIRRTKFLLKVLFR